MDSIALEVRWALAGDSIVLQLVGKIGEFTLSSIKILQASKKCQKL